MIEELNIPIYRGKKIDTENEYVEGYLAPLSNSNSILYMYAIEETFEIVKSITYKWFEQIDPTTVSIHHSTMIASDSDRLLPNGEKDLRIFASLSADGKGGDVIKSFSHYFSLYDRGVDLEETVIVEFGTFMVDNIPLRDLDFEKLKIIGIQK